MTKRLYAETVSHPYPHPRTIWSIAVLGAAATAAERRAASGRGGRGLEQEHGLEDMACERAAG